MLVVESGGGLVMLWDDDVTVPTHSTDNSLWSGLPLYSYILAGQQPRQRWCNRMDCLLWTRWSPDTLLQTADTMLTTTWFFPPFSFLGHISSILEDTWTLHHESSLFVAKQKEINNPSALSSGVTVHLNYHCKFASSKDIICICRRSKSLKILKGS